MEKAYIISRENKLVVVGNTLFRPGIFEAIAKFELSDRDKNLFSAISVDDCSMQSAEDALKKHDKANLDSLFVEAAKKGLI